MPDYQEGSRNACDCFARPGGLDYPRVARSSLPLIISLSVIVSLGVVPRAMSSQPDAVRHDPALSRLQTEIERLAQTAGGTVGVGAHHIEAGRQIYVNRAERFPMGSTFKIPLAVQLLALVDQGMVSLDKPITVQTSDLRPGSGTLVKLFDESRPTWSLRQLLELMLINSDNSATDIIWKEAGGREPVMGRLAALGIRGMSVDRPTALLVAAVLGIEPPPPEAERTPARFRELIRTVSRTKRDAAAAAFFKDRRDSATPEAMADLLVKIWRQQALSPDHSALLLDIMYRCATGRGRLRGMLPRGAKVAHKTGTLRIGVTNDVGIIPLPGGAGHIAIAVFIKESTGDLPTQERTIAEIARAIYDYFASNPIAASVGGPVASDLTRYN